MTEATTDATAEKGHTSATQLDMFCRCPEAYRRRYIEGEKIPPGMALLKGRGFHVGAQVNMEQKIESHRDLPSTEIIDAAVAAFEAETAGGYQLSDDEQSIGAATVIGDATDDLVEMVSVHATQQAPDYQPVLVEERIRIELPLAPRDLLGVIDLADDRGRVTDFKTAKRAKSQADADTSVQLSVYAAAYHARFGQPPSELRLDTIVKTTRKTSRQILQTARDEQDLQALTARINAVESTIQAGNFTPAPPGAWWCYSMDTEVLTRSGWRPGWQITEGDIILAYDPLTGLLSWQPVLATFHKNWRRPMVAYNGRGLRFCVTPDHEMLIRSIGRGRWRTAVASDLVGKGSICYPVSAYMTRPGVSFSDDQISLSGWLCAEGHFEEQSAGICLYQQRGGPYCDELHTLIQRLGYDYKTHMNDSADKLRLPAAVGHQVREFLQNDKAIPSWLHDCDARQFRVWLSAFLKGDGHQTSGTSWAVGQKDEAFIDELQGLCVTHRMSATKNERRSVSSTGGHVSKMHIIDGLTERITECASRGTHFEEFVCDEVWCVTVPTGFVMTRYRGRTLIAGNCGPKWCGYWNTCPFVNSIRKELAQDD